MTNAYAVKISYSYDGHHFTDTSVWSAPDAPAAGNIAEHEFINAHMPETIIHSTTVEIMNTNISE